MCLPDETSEKSYEQLPDETSQGGGVLSSDGWVTVDRISGRMAVITVERNRGLR